MTKPTLSIFTGTENFGVIYKEQNQINVKFLEFTVPLSDTSGNTAGQYGGKIRIIMLQGAHDGDGFVGANQDAKIKGFIDDIEAWVRGIGEPGFIQTSKVYTSSFGVNYNVKVWDWSWTRSVNDPNRILWSLMMKEV